MQIVEDVGWRGVRIDGSAGAKRGKPTAFPSVARHSYQGSVHVRHSCGPMVMCAVSPTAALISRAVRSTPRPIRLVRHAGHGPWDDTARAVLALSKMDWNNDALYDPLPVTIGYAKVLARVVKRMRGLGNAPYQFRFFM